MTVLDTCVALYRWFEKNDSLDAAKDFKSIFLISEDEDADRALLLVALQKLEEQSVISHVNIGDKILYVLNRKLDALEQDVTISATTATKVASVINDFCDDIDDHKDIADPSKILQKDIFHLALILEAWQQEKKKTVD
jgi:predicted nucleic acid-binding protein